MSFRIPAWVKWTLLIVGVTVLALFVITVFVYGWPSSWQEALILAGVAFAGAVSTLAGVGKFAASVRSLVESKTDTKEVSQEKLETLFREARRCQLEGNSPAQPLPATIAYASVNPTDLYARSPELPDVHFAIFFKVENKSLTRLENVRLGIITWILGSNEERISERLLENIEIIKPTGFRYPCKLVHYSCESSKTDTLTIGPYEVVRTKDFGKIAIPESEVGYEWQAALYLISEGFLPLWYQLTCEITNSRQFFSTENRPNNIQFNQVHNSLPIVTWK